MGLGSGSGNAAGGLDFEVSVIVKETTDAGQDPGTYFKLGSDACLPVCAFRTRHPLTESLPLFLTANMA